MANSNSNEDDFTDDEAIKLIDHLMAEKEGICPPWFPEKVDKDLTAPQFAIPRRLALEYLTRPFSETLEIIKNDRGVAVSQAYLAGVVRINLQSYEALVELLGAAEKRMRVQIGAAREDVAEIMDEARQMQAEAETPNLRYLRPKKGKRP